MNNVVLITGVAGFIGSYIANYFSEKGWSVLGIDCIPILKINDIKIYKYYCLKLPDSKFNNILKEYTPDVCVHCAGTNSVGESLVTPGNDFYSTTVLTFEILNSIRKNAPNCRFIFLSSAAVYGNSIYLPMNENHPLSPISPYGFHKMYCEKICIEYTNIYNIPTSIVRIFSAFGEGLRRQIIWDICSKILSKQSLLLKGTGKESRDFIHALDIAKAIMTIALNAPMKGEAYNVASGKEVSISDLTNLIIDALGIECNPVFDGIVPDGVPSNWRADLSKIVKLGFRPSIKFNKGIDSFLKWCKKEILTNEQ